MSKKLVAYYSATGTTRKAAQSLAEVVKADLYEIVPEIPYTSADLDWMDKSSRSSVEMRDKSFRPAIKKGAPDLKEYEVVFLGFPIWWYVAPTIINTFLEQGDFAGKTVVLFATSGGSGFGKAAAELRGSVADSARIVEGRLFNGRISKPELEKWVKELKLD